MKTKTIGLILSLLLISIAVGSCSKNEYNPEDSVSSILSGMYGKDGLWELSVTENDKPLENHGSVRFDSKYLKVGDFRFINVVPGEKLMEFKNIPLSETEKGISFKIEFVQNDKPVVISGIISFGKMTVDLKI